MRITESQLRRIIREELEGAWVEPGSPEWHARLADRRKHVRTIQRKPSVKLGWGDTGRTEIYSGDEFNDDDSGLWMVRPEDRWSVDDSEDVLDLPDDLLQRYDESFKSRLVQEATGGDGPERVTDKNFNHLEIGNLYRVKGMRGKQEFLGWFDKDGEEADVDLPAEMTRLRFLDDHYGDEWEAYFFEKRFCWGSSAATLVVKEL